MELDQLFAVGKFDYRKFSFFRDLKHRIRHFGHGVRL